MDVDLPPSGAPQSSSLGAVPAFAVQIYTSRFSKQEKKKKKAILGKGTFLAAPTKPEARRVVDRVGWLGRATGSRTSWSKLSAGGWWSQKWSRTWSSSDIPMAITQLDGLIFFFFFFKACDISGIDFHPFTEKKSTDLLIRNPDH